MRFSEIVGQEEVKNHIVQEIQSDKISHAQLFLGNFGNSTLPLALAYVQYLFCENKTPKDSCGECASCRKVKTLQHPDLHFSFPTVQSKSKVSDGFLNQWRSFVIENPLFSAHDWWKYMDEKGTKPIIGTDESASIIKKTTLRSFEGGYKVIIMFQAEAMNETCANKLLKLLEEPQPKTIFLLLAEGTTQLLPTILSRTQVVRVPSYSLDVLTHELEKMGASRDVSISLAARAEGSLLTAINNYSHAGDTVENRELFIQMMRACFKKDVNAMLDWVGAIGIKSREDQKVFVDYSLHMVRQSLLKNYTEEMLVRVSPEEAQFLSNFARFINNNNCLDFMELFTTAHYQLNRNAHGQLLFTNLCFQVMRFIHKA